MPAPAAAADATPPSTAPINGIAVNIKIKRFTNIISDTFCQSYSAFSQNSIFKINFFYITVFIKYCPFYKSGTFYKFFHIVPSSSVPSK
jgi:hypothetical protein